MRQQLLKASKILQNNEGIDGKELGEYITIRVLKKIMF